MPVTQSLLLAIRENTFRERKLSLTDQNLTAEDMLALVEALNTNTFIKELDLSHNAVSTAGAQALAALSHLESLDLTENNIGPAGAEAFATSKIQKLDISANPIGDAIKVFATSPFLNELIASECEITDEGAASLLTSQSIKTLDLSTNNIRGTFLASMKTNTVLVDLNLAQNALNSECCDYFSHSNTLRRLDLSGTFVGDMGAALLSKNSSLTELMLSQCSINDAGALALSQNKSLKCLTLFNNHIGNTGVQSLADNTALLHLNLTNNPYTQTAASILATHYSEETGSVFTRNEAFIAALLKKKFEHHLTSGTFFTPQQNRLRDLDSPEKRKANQVASNIETILHEQGIDSELFLEHLEKSIKRIKQGRSQDIADLSNKPGIKAS